MIVGQLVAAKAFMYLPKEVDPFLSSNAAKEGSANTCLVKGAFYETVAPGAMLNAVECNRVFQLFCSTEEG